VGARHQLQVEPDPEWLGRASVRRGLATLAAAGLAYDVVVSPEQLALVTRVARQLDEVRFVLDHAGKPPIAAGRLDDWSADVAGLAALGNVSVKLSGLVTEASLDGWAVADLRPASDRVLEAFGPARVMFGSDWPVCLLAGASYDAVVATTEELVAGLSAVERDAVWGGTAADVYGLAVA
jgi:L-fuconolactonase